MKPLRSVVVSVEAAKMILEGAAIIYRKWVREAPRGIDPGELVVIEDPRGDEIGCALYDTIGPVALRVVWVGQCKFETPEEMIRHHIGSALRRRRKAGLTGERRGFRLVHSDGDLLPGLIIDVYDDLAVIQSSSVVWDVNMRHIVDAVVELLGVEHVYEKSTQRTRRDIGLPPRERMLRGSKHWAIIEEQGVVFKVDARRGQKTGFFLDQRDNRIFLERLVDKGDVVLDLFSYTGGFGLHALHAGARKVVFVDEDEIALQVLRENLRLNRFDDRLVEVRAENVWDFLRREKRVYNVVVVDPPAFIQSREHYERGRRAYRRLYSASARLVEDSGVLFLSSCSTFLTRDDYLRLVGEALADAKRGYTLIGGVRGAPPDHPVRSHGEHLEYLKAAFLEVY